MTTEDSDIRNAISEIDKLALVDPDAALAMCESKIASTPSAQLARKRGSLLTAMGRYGDASRQYRAVAYETAEPADHFDSARAAIRGDDMKSALESLDLVLAIGAEAGFSYYESSARFFRAFVCLQLGKSDEAAQELDRLDPEFQLWIPGVGLRTVQGLRPSLA